MLWTVMPLDVVLAGSDSYRPSYVEIRRGQAVLLVEAAGANAGKLARLISSDPNDNLKPELQPGMNIGLNG